MNFNLFGPQQQGLRMPQGPSLGLTMPQGQSPGFQIPPGMADQANAGILADLQRRMGGGISPMAFLQMANMGQGMMNRPPPQMPQIMQAPQMPINPYKPRWREGLFS